MGQVPEQITPLSAKKRLLNELKAKVLNEEKSDTVIGMRKGTSISDRADMLFGCECDKEDCEERIAMSTQEYAGVHRKHMHFIVVPSHVRLDIEEVVNSFSNYCVVRKIYPQTAK
jgi:hypothetical protein